MALSRRQLLSKSALAGVGWPVFALSDIQVAFGGQPQPDHAALLIVFLRGGFDGLSLVMPIAGADLAIYNAERPNLAIPASGKGGAWGLNDQFGMHPAAKPLHELYQKKSLAVIHAAGMTEPNRSHFDAQAMIELGTPGRKAGDSGWLARYLRAEPRTSMAGGEIAIAVGGMLPTMLLGMSNALVMNNANGLNIGGKQPNVVRAALRDMYTGTDGWLGSYGVAALDAMDLLEGLASKDYVPSNNAEYLKNEAGNKLKTVAQLLKMPLGLTAAAVDLGGWDTHKYQGAAADGKFADLIGQLAAGLSALLQDVGGQSGRKLTILVMSEFGRRLKENANKGTDHGHGNVMLLMGDRVNGGNVYTEWPGLKTEQLYDRADLAVTTDFRQVVVETLQVLGKGVHPELIFPGFRPGKTLGLLRNA